jgi:hypothetical protein
VGIAALALLAVVHQFRDRQLFVPPPGSILLGVLPNFAAAIAITFVLFSIWLDQKRSVELASPVRPFLFCAAISGAGLFGWEFLQLSTNRLVFDPDDLIATLAGLAVAGGVFLALSRLDHRPM